MNGTRYDGSPRASTPRRRLCDIVATLGRLWAVDIANDFSAHSATTGALSLGFDLGGVEAFGNGIAFQSDCGRFEIPFGVESAGQ